VTRLNVSICAELNAEEFPAFRRSISILTSAIILIRGRTESSYIDMTRSVE
jgi:hypothetical protein